MIITNACDAEAVLADRSLRGGPGVALASDYFYLRDEDYIRGGQLGDLATIKQQNLVVWSRGVSLNVQQAEKHGIACLLGPDFVFNCNPTERARERAIFDRSNVAGVLVLNQSDLIGSHHLKTKRFRGTVARVRHFLRPELFARPFHADRTWDVLVYHKANIEYDYIAELERRGKRVVTVTSGQYGFDELVDKAERSKVCIYDSQWDSYGLAAQEIMACGCPIICGRSGIQEGNFLEGRMGFYVNNGLPYYDGTEATMRPHLLSVMCSDSAEMDLAIAVVSAWNNRSIYDAAREFNDPTAVKALFRNALLGSIAVYGAAHP